MSNQENPFSNEQKLSTFEKGLDKKYESSNITLFLEGIENKYHAEITKRIIDELSPYMDIKVHIQFKSIKRENPGFNSILNPRFRNEDYYDSITINSNYEYPDELPFTLIHELGHSFEEKLEQLIKDRNIEALPVGIDAEYADFYADLIAVYILKPELLNNINTASIAENTVLAIREMFNNNNFAELRKKIDEISSNEITTNDEGSVEKEKRLTILYERVLKKIDEYCNV